MANVADRDALRNAVLLDVYEKSGGDTMEFIEESAIATSLAADPVDVRRAVEWLADRNLLKLPVMGPIVSISPNGVDVAEDMLREEAKELALSVTVDELRLIEGLVVQVELAVESGKITLVGDDLVDLQAQLDTLRAQSRSPKPRRKIISSALKVLRYLGDASVQQIIGGAAFEGLKALLT